MRKKKKKENYAFVCLVREKQRGASIEQAQRKKPGCHCGIREMESSVSSRATDTITLAVREVQLHAMHLVRAFSQDRDVEGAIVWGLCSHSTLSEDAFPLTHHSNLREGILQKEQDNM